MKQAIFSAIRQAFTRVIIFLFLLILQIEVQAQLDERRFFGITIKPYDEMNSVDAIQQENILKCFLANNLTITESNTDEFYKSIGPFMYRVIEDADFVKKFCERFAEKSISGNIWIGDCSQYLSNGFNIQNEKNAEKLKGLLKGYNDGLYTAAKYLLQARILYAEQFESYSQFNKAKADLFINPPENLTNEDVLKFYDNIPRHELQRKLRDEVTNIFQYLQRRNKDDLFKIDEIVKSNLQKNGWTESQIKNTYNNPAFKARTISADVIQNIKSYYFNPDCSYIIVNTLFQKVIGISDKTNGNNITNDNGKFGKPIVKTPTKKCGQDESKGTEIDANACLKKLEDPSSPCPFLTVKDIEKIITPLLVIFPADFGRSINKIKVNKDDFVFFKVKGNITIGSYTENGKKKNVSIRPDGDDSKLLLSNEFKKINAKHSFGQVLALIGDATFPAEQLSMKGYDCKNIPGEEDYFRSYFKKECVNYFVSPIDGEVEFILNDANPYDNKGDYTIEVYKISQQQHLNRNCLNKCPRKKPELQITTKTFVDTKGNVWSNPIYSPIDALLEVCYHCGLKEYRAVESRSEKNINGCQCVYLNNGVLVNYTSAENCLGTFDYGYWKDKEDMRLHFILDIAPHLLYNIKMGLRYSIIPMGNIY